MLETGLTSSTILLCVLLYVFAVSLLLCSLVNLISLYLQVLGFVVELCVHGYWNY